jgi:hypothetical protein
MTATTQKSVVSRTWTSFPFREFTTINYLSCNDDIYDSDKPLSAKSRFELVTFDVKSISLRT